MVAIVSAFFKFPSIYNSTARASRFILKGGFSTLPDIPSLIPSSRALELHQRSDVKFIDGSWHLDPSRDALKEFNSERIVGAQYFSIDEAADKTNNLPHMIPSEKDFETYVSNLGVSSTDHVVVYGTKGALSVCRVWYMFRLFGHSKVSVLDGGLPGWKTAGGSCESGPVHLPEKGDFHAKLNDEFVINAEGVLKVVESGNAQILDARAAQRFNAEVPEPRKGIIGGHIPGSLNLPFQLVLDEQDPTKFKSVPEIRDALVNNGVVLGANQVLTCGSGVTACFLLFGLHLVGKDLKTLSLYDGSWSEWGSKPELPKIP